MLPAFVITLREGLEAFLIVAISLAFLRKSGRQQLIPAVHWGIVVQDLTYDRTPLESLRISLDNLRKLGAV